jgi:hypothetical protein
VVVVPPVVGRRGGGILCRIELFAPASAPPTPPPVVWLRNCELPTVPAGVVRRKKKGSSEQSILFRWLQSRRATAVPPRKELEIGGLGEVAPKETFFNQGRREKTILSRPGPVGVDARLQSDRYH